MLGGCLPLMPAPATQESRGAAHTCGSVSARAPGSGSGARAYASPSSLHSSSMAGSGSTCRQARAGSWAR